MSTPFTGLGTALVTPFRKDGSIDEAAVRRLVRRQIDAGVHFVSPCGTTGEAPTLSHSEKIRVVQLVVDEAAGRVPVLAGAGGYDTREVIELAREYERHRRGRHPVGHAVLQQADAGRAVSALQGDRREHARSRSCSTTCPGAPASTSKSATVAPSLRAPQHRRHQGSVRQPGADERDRRGRARRVLAAERRRSDCRRGDGGRRHAA